MKLPHITALLTACLLSGCAWIDVRPVDPCNVRNTRGFIFYDQKLVLIVDNKGEVRFWAIADMTKPRAANSYAFFSSAQLDLKLDNGVLAGATSKVDTSAAIALAEKFIPTFPVTFSAPNGKKTTKHQLKSGIYEVVFNDCGQIANLVEVSAMIPQIPVVTEDK